ncbi:MAG: hypothetical protein LC649_02080 [Bacteroidales bacterium]|nr:hypothetical protein [Bacteroidales bacterium]
MKSNTIYKAAVVFLLITNIVTVLSFRKITIDNSETVGPVIEQTNAGRMDYFIGNIGFDKEQMDQFYKAYELYNREAGKINRELLELRRRMITEVSGEDTADMDSVLKAFGEGHIMMKKITIDYYERLREIADEDQEERLESAFREMLDPQGPIWSRGPRRDGHGRGRGPGLNRERGQGYRNGPLN